MDSLGLMQKPIVMRRYPHMMPEDTEVWTRFLQTQQFGIKGVWYDVRVGRVEIGTERTSDLIYNIARGLQRKRIDVVCSVGGGYWVVEVKPRANMEAIGQTLIYARLFVQDYRPPGLVVPIIVCSQADNDLLGFIDQLGVGVITTS